FTLGWGFIGFIFLILFGFVTSFFRDPDRPIPSDPRLVLCPADGKVVGVDEVEIEMGEGGRARLRRVSFFLSIFNNHIQRAPRRGVVKSIRYTPGKFINAMSDKSSDENENNLIWFESEEQPFGVKQIAGLIARRVVCSVRTGQKVAAGQRIGLIRFGSRVEAFFPLDARVQVQIGQTVKGGISILAHMPEKAPAIKPEPAE
ncbi:phosphatidylserine decarboxylase family protein, partial [bacterium]|nr:phosphatidylserine decarboxylase family protein [bacterium]